MDLDEELDIMEDGAETDAEQVDEESEIEDVAEFQDDEEFDPDAEEEDLEEAYEGFFSEEGPEGEGNVDDEGNDGGLASAVSEIEGIDLSEEGFHIVDEDDATDEIDEIDEALDEEDEEYEIVELELDEDDIVRYLEDEEGNRIGFVLMEDGEEAEYLYVESDEEGDEDDNEFDFGITKEGVAQATNDMNAIYKDGIAVAAELKGAFDDIKSAFDFGSVLKK